MRKIALLLISAAVVTVIACSLTMRSHHAAAVSQSAPMVQNAAAPVTRDSQLEWNFAPEPITLVGDGSAGN